MTPPRASTPTPSATRGRVLLKAAPVYDAVMCCGTMGGHGRLTRATAVLLAPSRNERILDVGCGTGILTLEAARRLGNGGMVVGIDASPTMIRVAERKRGRPHCRFQVALAEALPFEDASFDAVCSSMFFHHVDAQLKRLTLQEIVRVLRPGGRVVIADMAPPYNLFGALLSHGARILLCQPEILENIQGLLPAMMKAAGLIGVREVCRRSGYIRVYRGTRREG